MYFHASVAALLLQIPRVKGMSQYSLCIYSVNHCDHSATAVPSCALRVSSTPHNALCIAVAGNIAEKHVTPFVSDMRDENRYLGTDA